MLVSRTLGIGAVSGGVCNVDCGSSNVLVLLLYFPVVLYAGIICWYPGPWARLASSPPAQDSSDHLLADYLSRRYQTFVYYSTLWHSAKSNCGGLWPRIGSFVTQEFCGLWPQRTVATSGCKIPYVFWEMVIIAISKTHTEFRDRRLPQLIVAFGHNIHKSQEIVFVARGCRTWPQSLISQRSLLPPEQMVT